MTSCRTQALAFTKLIGTPYSNNSLCMPIDQKQSAFGAGPGTPMVHHPPHQHAPILRQWAVKRAFSTHSAPRHSSVSWHFFTALPSYSQA